MSLTSFVSLKVTRTEQLAKDITLIALSSTDGAALPAFEAGSHLTVRTPLGANRQYSLCSDPANTLQYEIAIKREGRGRGGSLSLVDSVRAGSELLVGPIANNFALQNSEDQALFIAGGIGITPFISMIHQLRASNNSNSNNFKLFYLARDHEHTAFKSFLAPLVDEGSAIIHHDHGDAAKQFDLWPILETPTEAHIYCCGPKSLMDSVRDMAGHWPQKQIHFENFNADIALHDTDSAFVVAINSSSCEFQVEAGESILNTLRANGIDVASSCESGTCGSCRVGLIEGIADHRDLVLFDDEKDSHIMVCVSRAKTARLVLDL